MRIRKSQEKKKKNYHQETENSFSVECSDIEISRRSSLRVSDQLWKEAERGEIFNGFCEDLDKTAHEKQLEHRNYHYRKISQSMFSRKSKSPSCIKPLLHYACRKSQEKKKKNYHQETADSFLAECCHVDLCIGDLNYRVERNRRSVSLLIDQNRQNSPRASNQFWKEAERAEIFNGLAFVRNLFLSDPHTITTLEVIYMTQAIAEALISNFLAKIHFCHLCVKLEQRPSERHL